MISRAITTGTYPSWLSHAATGQGLREGVEEVHRSRTRASGVASPKIFGGAKCLILGEYHYILFGKTPLKAQND